jgi:hypothetical protein
MSRHLNEEQISAVVAGLDDVAGADVADHLQICALCRHQVERLEGVMGHFRGSVREWSDAQFVYREAVLPRRSFWPALAYSWFAAMLVLFSVIGYRYSSAPTPYASTQSSSPDSDTLLLNRVKADVSRSAPPGMETLLGFTTEKTVQR